MVIATPICAKDAEERNNTAIASRKGRMNRLRIRDHLLLSIPPVAQKRFFRSVISVTLRINKNGPM
jgi:hypothetical protein